MERRMEKRFVLCCIISHSRSIYIHVVGLVMVHVGLVMRLMTCVPFSSSPGK